MKENSLIMARPAIARSLPAALLIAAAAFTPAVHAANVIKSSAGTDLTAGASWTNGVAPGSGDNAIWAGSSLGAGLTLGTAQSWGGIVVTNAASAIGVTGAGPLTLGANGINMTNSAVNFTLGIPTVLGASQIWTVASGKGLTNSGVISDGGSGYGLTLNGAGTVTLLGANTYSGVTTLSVGDVNGLVVANAAALGTGSVLVNGGQNFSSAITVNTGLNVTNAVTLKRGASGTGRAAITLNSGAAWSGPITVDNTSATAFPVIWSGGNSAANACIVSGNIGYSTLGTGTTFALRGSSMFGKLAGPFSLSTGYVQILDSGRWEFDNTNNVWGTLDVANVGAIAYVGATNALATNGVVLSSVGGTLQLTDFSGTNNYPQSIAGLGGNINVKLPTNSVVLTLNVTSGSQTNTGVISGLGSLVKTGSGTQVLGATNGINTFSGGTTLSGGYLVVATNNALGTNLVTIGASAVGLTIRDGQILTNNITISGGSGAYAGLLMNSGTGNATLSGGTITITGSPATGGHFAGASTGTLTVADPVNSTGNVIWRSGTGIFSGGGSYLGFFMTGTVKLGANNGLANNATISIGNSGAATLDLAGYNQTVAGIANIGSSTALISNSSATNDSSLTTTGNSTFGGVIMNGTHKLLLTVNGGTLTLAGTNTYTGGTTINAGTLTIGGAGLLGNGNYAGAITNAGALVFNSTAVQILSGTISGSGSTTVSNGFLYLNGTAGAVTAATGGTFGGEGSVGTVTVQSGGYLEGGMGGAGLLTVTNLNLGAASGDYETVVVTPNATTAPVHVMASNGLNVSSDMNSVNINVGGGLLASGTYHLIQYSGSILGAGFGAFQLGTTPGGNYTYSLANNAGSVDLVVVANSDTWSGAFGSEWSINTIASPKNWVASGSPVDYADGQPVIFDDSASGTTAVSISAADVNPASVLFNNNGKNYTLSGPYAIANANGTTFTKTGTGTVTINNVNSFASAPAINGGTVSVSTVANQNVNSPLGAGSQIMLGGGKLSYTGGTASSDREIYLTGDSAMEVTAPATTLTIAGTVDGSTGLTKTGNGTLALASYNSYTGNTTISAGTLTIADPGYLGNAAYAGNITNDAVLVDNSSAAQTWSGVISGTGTLTNSGGGTLTLSGVNTFTGGTTLAAGQLNLNSSKALGAAASPLTIAGTSTIDNTASGAITIANGNPQNWNADFTFAGSQNLNLGAGPVTLGGDRQVTVNANTLTVGGAIGGAHNLTLAGAGTLSLNGTNTYTGNTTISAGTLNIGGAGQLGGGNYAGNITNNAAFTYGSSATQTLAGVISGGGTLTALLNSGALTLSGANTYTTITTIKSGAGLVTVQNNQSAANGGWLIGPDSVYYTTVNFAAGSSVAVAGGNEIQIGNTAATGFSTQNLNAAGTVNNSGMLFVGRDANVNLTNGASWNQAGDMSLNGLGGYSATLNVNSNSSFAYTGTDTIKLNAGTSTAGAGNVTVDGTGVFTTGIGFENVNTGNAGFGRVTLSNGGTVRLSADVAALTTQVQFNLGTNGGVIDNNGHNVTLSGSVLAGTTNSGIFGPGSLTSKGGGTLTLTGTNTYTGNTIISSGTLALAPTGSIASSTNLVIAGGATLDISATAFALGASQVLSNLSATAVVNGNVNASVGTVAFTYAPGTPSLEVTNGTLTLAAGTGCKVNNTGAALAVGSYKLIAAATTGNAGAVAGTVPAFVSVGGNGLMPYTTNSLQITGGELYLVVTATVNTTPPVLANSVSNGSMTLSWPSDHTGWRLLMQTNNLAAGISSNTNDWGTVAGSAATNQVTIPVDATKSDEFYRLVYP